MRKLSVPWNLEPGQHKTTEHFQPMYIYIYMLKTTAGVEQRLQT